MVFKPVKKLNPLPEQEQEVKRTIRRGYEPSPEEVEEEYEEEEVEEEVEEVEKSKPKKYPEPEPSKPMLTREEAKDIIIGNLSRAVELIRML